MDKNTCNYYYLINPFCKYLHYTRMNFVILFMDLVNVLHVLNAFLVDSF